MVNRECALTSAVSAKWSNWFYRTGQLNYILNEIYPQTEWFGFARYIIIDSF